MMGMFKPALSGDPWLIGKKPNLGALQGREAGEWSQQCVDHHITQSRDGEWQLWACVRNTAIGRLFYHWSSQSLDAPDWVQTGEVIRADRSFGESLETDSDREWLLSPFFVASEDELFMFYGGHSTGSEAAQIDRPQGDRANCQLCLMRSDDGRTWHRHDNGRHRSRVFVGPGEVRDPCVVKMGDLWYMYYAGFEVVDGVEMPGIYLRRSFDLLDWSQAVLVHRDLSPRFGAGLWDTECPFVAQRGAYFYLLRTEDYASARTHVFRSKDPLNFGIEDASSHYVCRLSVAAPEIIVYRGGEYISSCDRLTEGITLCKLDWVPDEER
jgi:Glycosyl hydrolases family 32 N-terminal domain